MILNISYAFIMSWNITSIYDWIFVDCVNQKEQKKWNTDLKKFNIDSNKDVIIQNFLVMKIDCSSLT